MKRLSKKHVHNTAGCPQISATVMRTLQVHVHKLTLVSSDIPRDFPRLPQRRSGCPEPTAEGNTCPQLSHTLYTVLCTVYCALFSVLYTVLYTLFWTVYCMLHSILYTVHCIIHSILYTVHCTIYCTLYAAHWESYYVQFANHPVHCTVYTLYSVQCTHCTVYTLYTVLYTAPLLDSSPSSHLSPNQTSKLNNSM